MTPATRRARDKRRTQNRRCRWCKSTDTTVIRTEPRKGYLVYRAWICHARGCQRLSCSLEKRPARSR